MIVCSCRGVSDRTIRAVMARGASSIEELTAQCGAANHCRGCWPELERLLASYPSDRDADVAVAMG
jgi:bacterioferritin-associated ferredoxin